VGVGPVHGGARFTPAPLPAAVPPGL